MNANVTQTIRAQVRGHLVQPGDPDYDSARAVHNGMIDRRPALVVQPSRLLCTARTCRSNLGGASVYANPAHITKPVAGRLQRYFAPVVTRLLASAR